MPDIAEVPNSSTDRATASPGTQFTQGGNPSYSHTSGKSPTQETSELSKPDLSVMMKQAQQGRA
jgi:hypothetical protein